MKYKFFGVLLALLAVGLMSCEDKITNQIDDIDVTPQEQRLTEAGWAAFENGDLAIAKDNFMAAINENGYYADAYNGLGWVYARLHRLDLSHDYFTLGRISAETDALFRDASAGRSFVNLALDQYGDAITDANDALLWDYYYYYVEYVFRHDLNITEMDLLLVKAESYFLLEDYQSCYGMLMLIDDSLDISASNPEELAAAIEMLKGSV